MAAGAEGRECSRLEISGGEKKEIVCRITRAPSLFQTHRAEPFPPLLHFLQCLQLRRKELSFVEKNKMTVSAVLRGCSEVRRRGGIKRMCLSARAAALRFHFVHTHVTFKPTKQDQNRLAIKFRVDDC